MHTIALKVGLAATVFGAFGCACSSCADRTAEAGGADVEAVGIFRGGSISRAQLNRELSRLPPTLRERFGTPEGQRELVRSLIDKQLLVGEARRRGKAELSEVRTQVRELEERLIVQELLAEEERFGGPATEAELRVYYEAHKHELSEPERVRVARILVASDPKDPAAKRGQARARAENLRARLRRGELVARLAAEGEGPERTRGGDLGLWAAGQGTDPRLEQAAFALKSVGEVSAVLETNEGFAVLTLLERRSARVPSFEESRAAIEGRVAPAKKRQVFEQVLRGLRQDAAIEVIP